MRPVPFAGLAALALALAAAPLAPVAAAPCIRDGARVTLSGKLHHRTVPPHPADSLPGHSYDQLLLEQPFCMQEGDFNGVAAARTVAIMPEGHAGKPEGTRVTLTGRAIHKTSSNEPPDDVQLDTSP